MIHAELQGKLGSDLRLAHERLEDLLTSTAFGLLRYLPPDVGYGDLLRRTRRVTLDAGNAPDRLLVQGPLFESLSLAVLPTTQLWPWWRGHGEPDVLIELTTTDDQRHLMVIEAKLHASMSGEAGDDDEPAPPDRPDPDQLVRYWHGLKAQPHHDATVSLIYLTAHSVPPVDELTASLARCPAMRLGWLSWHDVWRTAQAAAQRSPELLAAADLAALLVHKGLNDFYGFHHDPLPTHLRIEGFWRTQPWFTNTTMATPMPTTTGFWKDLS